MLLVDISLHKRCKWILKTRYKKLVSHVESHASATSAQERRIALWKKKAATNENLLPDI